VIILGVEIDVMTFDVDLASALVAFLHQAVLYPLPHSPRSLVKISILEH